MTRTTICLLTVLLLAAARVPAAAPRQLLVNGTFSEVTPKGTPVGWEHRTPDQGSVQCLAEGETNFVRVAVNRAGESSILQQWVKWPDETVKLRFASRCRWRDIVPGDKSHMRGKIQGRWRINGKEAGDWIDLGSLEGASDGWAEKRLTVGIPAGADAAFMRVALYSVKSGQIDADYVTCEALSSNDVAAAEAERLRLAAVERARYRPAEAFGPEVGSNRLARLSRGVNINNWLGQPYNARMGGNRGSFTPAWFDGFVTDEELRQLAALGFRHIRLPFDPEPFMNLRGGGVTTNATLLAAFDRTLQRIRAAGLAVVVDAHPKMPRLKAMKGNEAVCSAFLTWWDGFAEHLNRSTDPEWTFIEPMNEPGGQGFYGQDWFDYQDRLFSVVRRRAPSHTLIGNAGGYQLHWELARFTPHSDRNILYAFHYYEPGPFTHQGSVWMRDWYHPLRSVPWPFGKEHLSAMIASLDRSGANKAKAAKSEVVLRSAVEKGLGTPGNIAKGFEEALAWSRKHGRTLVVGEFGCENQYSELRHKAAWAKAVRENAEAAGMGWTWWDYAGSMSFMGGTNAPGQRVVLPEMVEALGLGQ